jgi:hypothetical protein
MRAVKQLRLRRTSHLEAVRAAFRVLIRRVGNEAAMVNEPAGTDTAPIAPTPFLSKADRENLDRASALNRVDLREHNRIGHAPAFSPVVSQATTSDQFEHPDYARWAEVLGFVENGKLIVRGTAPTILHRKIWEWAFILQATEQYGLLQPGRTAVGFGVGNEPIPAAFARYGLSVIATDQDARSSKAWHTTGEWLTGVEGLLRPAIAPDERVMDLVAVRRVDMNDVPSDLGPYDVTWSSCALEHLGSPEKGLEFVLATSRLLAPGGIAVHTTEMELTRRETTADWGHLACYRPADLRWLADQVRAEGLDIELNFHVPMDTAEDRWISVVPSHGPELAAGELSHLKVAIGESVSTSFGILIHRPPAG